MPDISAQITRLEQLTHDLVNKYEHSNIQNEQLQKKVAELENDLRRKNSELALLEGELKTARVAKGIAGGGGGTELARAKIGSLVREIDRCIALLNE